MLKSVLLLGAVCALALPAQTPPAAPPQEAPKPAQAPKEAPAQTPTPPAPSSQQEQQEEEESSPAFVRRISIGATLSVNPIGIVRGGDLQINTTNPVSESVFKTEAKTYRAGYGGTVQLALTERFAVAAAVLLRRTSYTYTSDIHTGVDNPTTLADERGYRASKEETRARFLDVPVLLRYYGKDRHDEGHRWFVEGGGALRHIKSLGSSTQTTVQTETVCCSTTPITPAHRNVRGAVAGAGAQFIDPLGIRVVPEFRYTRWFAEPFNNSTTTTRRNQFEIILSLTF
jgi:hypothetical protein